MQLDNKKIQIKAQMLIWNNLHYGEYLKIGPQKIFLDFARVNSFATAFIPDIIRAEYQY